MRRVLIICLLALACGRERPAAPEQTTTTAAPATTTTQAPAPAAPRVAKSTPQQCAGDGSYAQALECFAMSAGHHFVLEEKSMRAEGEMTRPTPGAERVQVRVSGIGANDGEWVAESKVTGVAWSRGGKAVANVPPEIGRIYQRVTLFFDPQKKEGAPVPEGEETMGGEPARRYRFTNANNNDTHLVWISMRDGSIRRYKIDATIEESFPSVDVRFSASAAAPRRP